MNLHMDKAEILERVKIIISSAVSDINYVSPSALHEDTQLSGMGQLRMDSIQFVRLMIEIEEEFGLMITEEAFLQAKIQTIGNVVDFVEQQLNQ